jgi:hypothetical protein
MYGHQQECARKAAERCETQDLEARLARIYAAIEGGDDAADMTAPRGASGDRRPLRSAAC